MNKLKFIPIIFLSFLLVAQEEVVEEISIDEQRNNAINELINVIKANKGIYIDQDKKRVQKFLDRVEERTKLLNDAKVLLSNE